MKNLGSILVVEDDDAVREMFVSCLCGAGYNVRSAPTGRQGMDLVFSWSPDLVLLDVRLPDMNGVEICRRIKADLAHKDVFVVLCSGEAISPQHKVDGLETGADEYLTKPIGAAELLARMHTLMRLRSTTAALRASEEHHRRLIDILPDAVCLIHPKGRLLAANSQAASMFGWAGAEDILQLNIFDLARPEECDRMKANFMTALREGVLRNAEYNMLKKNGTPFLMELNATVSLGASGQSTGLLSVARDITERQRAQQALRASEERFRQLAHHIREVFWMSNAMRTEFIYVSPAYKEIWGQSCESLYAVPKNWMDSILPEDRARVSPVLNPSSPAEYDEVYRIMRPDGSIRWIQDRAFPIRDEAGRIYRLAGIADDITKRKQAWDALGESEARKRAIMQAALDGVITIDHEGQVVETNPAAEKIFGYSRSRPRAGSIGKIIASSHQSWFQSGLATCFTGGQGPALGARVEMQAVRSDGTKFPAEFTITRIKLAGPPMFTIYIRDITQQKSAEAELRALPQRIIKAQESERSRIAQELHDGINQMIASVKMRLRKVEGSLTDLKPAAREILGRCDRLLVKVLEENRRIAHNLRPTDLDNLGLAAACGSLCNEVQSRTGLRVRSKIDLPPTRLPATLELHLFRIVQEGLNNIEKHAKAKSVKVDLKVENGVLMLKIQDDGRGLGTPSGKGRSRGHGLGLSNMSGRAESLGGVCEFKSKPGKGTTILVQIPFGEGEMIPAAGKKTD